MGISMTRREIADIAGYSYHQLYNIDKALPEGKRLFVEGDGKKVDLATFVQRWVAYNVEKASSGGDNLEDEKARHERLKADKAEIEVGRMKGEYVNINDIVRMWTDITGVVVNRLVNLPKKLAPQLVMIEDPETAEEIVARDVRDALEMISSTPLPGEGGLPPEAGESDEPE